MAPPSEHVLDIHNLAEFKASLSSNSLIVLQATATWCGPCKAISPMFNKHAATHADKPVRFLRFDIDEDGELCQELGIRSVPAFFFFENGNKVHSLVGAVPPSLEKGVLDLVAKGESRNPTPGDVESLPRVCGQPPAPANKQQLEYM